MAPDITARLKALRREAGFTQPALAKHVNDVRPDWNWHQTTIAKIESGERAVKYEDLLAFAEVFGMGLDEFVFGNDVTEGGHQTTTAREMATLRLARKRWELEMYQAKVRDLERSIEQQLETDEKWGWSSGG